MARGPVPGAKYAKAMAAKQAGIHGIKGQLHYISEYNGGRYRVWNEPWSQGSFELLIPSEMDDLRRELLKLQRFGIFIELVEQED